MTSADAVASFADLGLRKKLLSALTELGYIKDPGVGVAATMKVIVKGLK